MKRKHRNEMLAALRELPNTLRSIVRHPLNRGREFEALLRFVRWHVGSRLVPGPVVVEVTPNARLLVGAGMRGATGSVYCGLLEFEDMSFVLHATRPGDRFVDVGANVGVYSVLAASVGATCISFEPTPETYRSLVANLALNGVQEHAEARASAVGASSGAVEFAIGQDTLNHVRRKGDPVEIASVSVPVTTLDAVLPAGPPTLIKIDVEGFETEVIRGARDVLSRSSTLALIVEVNETSEQYGSKESAFDAAMRDVGYRSFSYDPFLRRLAELPGINRQANNTIYIRDDKPVRDRLASAEPFEVLGRSI